MLRFAKNFPIAPSDKRLLEEVRDLHLVLSKEMNADVGVMRTLDEDFVATPSVL